MGISLGICGAGRFASAMAPLFAAHPLVDEVFVADLLRDRAEAFAGEVGASRVLASLEELCESDVDAVAIMTQRQLHGPQALLALEAGKHVYSAVPVGQTLDEVRAIVEAVERTGLVYMMGETSYYYPSAIYCRQRFQSGDFGEFVYGEGEYYHDMSHFYESFRRSGGADWKRVAGIPPMHYSTHSVAEVLSVTGARATSVSCMGFRDRHEDGVFGHGVNLWDNPFSNETAIMRTSDGGVMRINELRRIGWPRPVPGRSPSPLTSVQMSIYGTRACFEEQSDAQTWVTLDPEEVTDVTGLLECRDGPSEFHSGAVRGPPRRPAATGAGQAAQRAPGLSPVPCGRLHKGRGEQRPAAGPRMGGRQLLRARPCGASVRPSRRRADGGPVIRRAASSVGAPRSVRGLLLAKPERPRCRAARPDPSPSIGGCRVSPLK